MFVAISHCILIEHIGWKRWMQHLVSGFC